MQKMTDNTHEQYDAAKTRFDELNVKVLVLERQRQEADSGLSTLPSERQSEIERAADALLTGGKVPELVLERSRLARTLETSTFQLAATREAVSRQRRIVADLKSDRDKTIALDHLPAHMANVTAVIEAALTMAAAVQAERELRDDLMERDVQFSSVITAMPWNGFDLRDPNAKLTAYLLECVERGFCKPGDLPEIVRESIPPKAKPTPKPTARVKSDGWLMA